MIRGVIVLINGIPAAFIARSSNFSPKFPNVINAASNIANGKALEMSDTDPSIKNLATMDISSPLPMKSSIHCHKSWIMNIKRQIKKVAIKFFKKAFIMKISNFFM